MLSSDYRLTHWHKDGQVYRDAIHCHCQIVAEYTEAVPKLYVDLSPKISFASKQRVAHL